MMKKYRNYLFIFVGIWIGWYLFNLITSFTPLLLYKSTPFLFAIYLMLIIFSFLIFYSRKKIGVGKKFGWLFPVVGAICGPIFVVVFNNWLTIADLPGDALMAVNDLYRSCFHLNLIGGDPIGFGISAILIGLFLGIIFYASIGFGIGMLFYNRKMGTRILAIIFTVSIIPTILAYNYKLQETAKTKAEERLMNINELSKNFGVEKRTIKEILVYNSAYDWPSYKGYLPWQRYYDIEEMDCWLKDLLTLPELSKQLNIDEKSIKSSIDSRGIEGIKINNVLKYDLVTVADILGRNDIAKKETLKLLKRLTVEELAKYFGVDKEIIDNLIKKYELDRDAISYDQGRTLNYPREKVRKLLKSEGLLNNEK